MSDPSEAGMSGRSDRSASGTLEVRRLTLGPIESNGYLVRAPGARRGVVIDPGAEEDRIARAADEWDMAPDAILLTHAHMDHVGAVAGLKRRWEVPVYLHPADRPIYEAAPQHAAAFGLTMEPPPPPDRELAHGETVREAGLAFEVRHAPGHSPGGVVLIAEGHAFVGDCVFSGSVGRVDLPGGDAQTLLASIREQILTLPSDTILHPGHGPDTTVKREAESNPFLTGAVGWSG